MMPSPVPPSVPAGTVQACPVSPVTWVHVAPEKERQSAPVLQPGEHEWPAPVASGVHWFARPRLLVPHAVLDVHDRVHQVPLQVP